MNINTKRKSQYMNGAIASVLLTMIMSISSPAMADDNIRSGPISHERLLHKFDHNGTLGQREKYHARKTHARLDLNDNGRVGQRERQIARKAHTNRNR